MATVLDIVDHGRMVKPVDRLVEKDCYDYAVGLAQNDRSMSIPVWLREFLDFPKDIDKPLRTLVDDIKEYRGRSAVNITAGLLDARAAGLMRKAGKPEDFNQLWEGLAEVAVKFWVDKCPPEIRKKCYKRGLRKMLRVKSIRFFALYYLSTIHTGWFGLEGIPRKMKHSDIEDPSPSMPQAALWACGFNGAEGLQDLIQHAIEMTPATESDTSRLLHLMPMPVPGGLNKNDSPIVRLPASRLSGEVP
jgi:hypothetical protein